MEDLSTHAFELVTLEVDRNVVVIDQAVHVDGCVQVCTQDLLALFCCLAQLVERLGALDGTHLVFLAEDLVAVFDQLPVEVSPAQVAFVVLGQNLGLLIGKSDDGKGRLCSSHVDEQGVHDVLGQLAFPEQALLLGQRGDVSRQLCAVDTCDECSVTQDRFLLLVEVNGVCNAELLTVHLQSAVVVELSEHHGQQLFQTEVRLLLARAEGHDGDALLETHRHVPPLALLFELLFSYAHQADEVFDRVGQTLALKGGCRIA